MTEAPLMAGTYVLVTRGTGGIGKATAAGLAALGARVGITDRDQGAPRPPQPISAPQRATTPWTSLPPTCPPRRRCAVWPLSLDPPADSGRPFTVRFLHEEFSG